MIRASLLLSLLLPLSAHAAGVPGASTSVSVDLSGMLGETGTGGPLVADHLSETGNERADLLGLVTLEDSDADGTLSASFDYDAHAAVARCVHSKPDRVVVAGSGMCKISASAAGASASSPWWSPDISGTSVSAAIHYVIHAPQGFSLSGRAGVSPAGDLTVSLVGPDPEADPPYSKTAVLLSRDRSNIGAGGAGTFDYTAGHPGTYVLEISVNEVLGDPPFLLAKSSESKTAGFEFILTLPNSAGDTFPAPGEYTHPKVGTFLTDSPKLAVLDPLIVSETPVGGGLTDVAIRASLANSSLCPWNDLTLRIAESQPGQPDVLVLDGGTPETDAVLEFDPLAAGANAPPSDPADVLTVRVADADLPAFRASVLDGSRFIRHGREQWVFLYPVDLVSGERATQLRNAFIGAVRPNPEEDKPGGIGFDRVIDVCQGTILLEHEPEYSIPLDRVLAPGGLLGAGAAGTYSQGLDAGLPLLVNTTGEAVGGHPDYPSLLQMLKHGTVRDTYDGSHPSGLGVSEGFGGDSVAKAHPVHFNRVGIGGGIDLSGSVGIGPGPISVEFEIENLAVRKLLVTASLRANATLLVETRGAADNAGSPLAEQERELFSAPLFTVVLPCGLSVTPELSLAVGAAVTVPQGLSVPIQTAMEFTATAGWVDGQPFYDDDLRHDPPTVSPPALFGQLGASVEAWAKAELLCRLAYSGVGAGPTFGTELRGAFDLNPAGDPWWRLQGDLNLTAGVEFDLLGLLTFFDAETTLDTIEVFDLDAGGPLVPPAGAARIAADPPNPGLRPVAGESTRWVRALQLGNTQASPEDSYALPIAGTTDFLAGANRDVSRYRANGEHVWALTYPSAVIRDAASLPDGGFAVVTPGGTVDRYDADGNRIWISHRGLMGGPTFNINGLAVRSGEGGQPEIVVAGWHGQTDGTRVPCVAKLDDNGNVLWSKRYAPDRPGDSSTNTEANDLAVTPDGDIVLCGITSAMAVGPTPFSNIGPLGPDHGVVMKVDGDSGEFLWATLLASGRGTVYRHVAADPEGGLYASGNWGVNVLDDLPAMLISKLTGDGALVDTVLIGSAAAEGAEETIYPPGDLPNSGETPFDTIHDLVWANGSLWATGQIGVGNVPTGLSQAQDAFTMRLSRNLAVDRFAMHGGTGGEVFGAIADGGDGLVAVGHSTSFLPWPDGSGADGSAPGTQVCRLVAKLPWEGLLRFHDLSSGRQPAANDASPTRGAHYVYPRVLAASDVTAFGGILAVSGERIPSSDLPFVASDLALADLPFPPLALADTAPLAHHQLEFVPYRAISGFGDFLDWHQQAAESDGDGDGMDLATEFYHGTDSGRPDSVEPEVRPHPVTGAPALAFPVSSQAAAEGWAPPVEGSRDLQSWSSALPPGVTSEQHDGRIYIGPLLGPDEFRFFYRLVPAVAP